MNKLIFLNEDVSPDHLIKVVCKKLKINQDEVKFSPYSWITKSFIVTCDRPEFFEQLETYPVVELVVNHDGFL